MLSTKTIGARSTNWAFFGKLHICMRTGPKRLAQPDGPTPGGGRVYKLSFEKYPPTSTVRIDTHTAALKQRQPQFGGQRHKHYIHVDFRAASRRPHSATTNLLCKSYKRVLNVYRELARRSAQHVSVLVGSCDGPVTVVGISGSVICSRCACAPPFATPRPPRWRVRARH